MNGREERHSLGAPDDVVLAIDLGSTKISLSLWTAGGFRLERIRFATPRRGPDATLALIVERGRSLLAGRSVAAVGVSAGGPTDAARGVIQAIPNLPGWEDVAIGSRLAAMFAVPVAVENDANACALAEWLYGAGRGVSDLAFLTFSTGIGAGLILDGRLYRGHRNLAGEVGHQVVEPNGAPCGCGGRGCLEAYASGAGIRRQLEEMRRLDVSLPADARGLVERARAGDEECLDLLRRVAGYLARGLATLIFTINPARIILGTIAVGAGELLLAPLRQELEERVWPALLEGLDVVPAALGADLGDHAAYAVARQPRASAGP